MGLVKLNFTKEHEPSEDAVAMALDGSFQQLAKSSTICRKSVFFFLLSYCSPSPQLSTTDILFISFSISSYKNLKETLKL
jgi:hypothetical protein